MLGVRSFPLVPSIDKEVATNRLINQWICILLIHRIIFFYVLFFVNLDLWTMDEQLAKDLPIVTSKLTELNTHVTDATSYVNSLLQRVKKRWAAHRRRTELPRNETPPFASVHHQSDVHHARQSWRTSYWRQWRHRSINRDQSRFGKNATDWQETEIPGW